MTETHALTGCYDSGNQLYTKNRKMECFCLSDLSVQKKQTKIFKN